MKLIIWLFGLAPLRDLEAFAARKTIVIISIGSLSSLRTWRVILVLSLFPAGLFAVSWVFDESDDWESSDPTKQMHRADLRAIPGTASKLPGRRSLFK